MRIFIAAIAILIAGLSAPLAAAPDSDLAGPVALVLPEGPVRIIDGDTFEAVGVRFRLLGVDAPELSDPACGEGCGILASGALAVTLNIAKPATCLLVAADTRWHRVVVRCVLPDHSDIGELLVRKGWARNAPSRYREAGRTRWSDYGAAEDAARAERQGFWSCDWTSPAGWAERKACP